MNDLSFSRKDMMGRKDHLIDWWYCSETKKEGLVIGNLIKKE